MTKKKTEPTKEIVAVDELGQKYQIIEFTEYHDVSTFTTPGIWEEGLKEFRLSDGSPVNKLSDTDFEIVASGVQLRVTT